MNHLRSAEQIRHDLDTALDYQRRYQDRPDGDTLVSAMRSANEREIAHLRAELRDALSGILDVALDGSPVEDNRVSAAYLSRVLSSIQSMYRSLFRSLAADGQRVSRAETTLAVAGTGPGSFRVTLAVPPAQLELLQAPASDRVLDAILDLVSRAELGQAGDAGRNWAETQDDSAVRSMIKLSAALASSHGTTRLRYQSAGGEERIVALSASSARDLAMSLAGQSGREILAVTGHLEMAQDRPPRLRIETVDDVYSCSVPDELLDQVKSLLFDTVVATLVVDHRTSPTTGSPTVATELLDLEPAAERPTS